MLGNDIASFSPTAQGVVFDNLLASPPSGAKSVLENIHRRRNNWDSSLSLWEPHDLPLKVLSDCVNRLGLGTDVYTFLHPDAVGAIDKWLVRKGISTPVYYYESPEMLEYDLRFQRAVRIIYTSDQEVAKILGPRATVTPTDRAWTP
ncbi:hypothetical protein EBT31_16135 [bacterium]|jgi:hypothetical protein|nr:hypothetical protein [bacterium]